MTLKFSVTAAALLVATTGAVQAQEFKGAEVQYRYLNDTTADSVQTQILGSVELGFGAFGVQLDGAAWKYDSDPLDNSGVALHAFYQFSEKVAAGVFVGRDNWDGFVGTWNFVGIEGSFEMGALMTDVYVSRYSPTDGGPEYENFGLDASYYLNNKFAVVGGFNRSEFLGTNLLRITAGAEYKLANGLVGQASVGRTTFDGANGQTVVGLSVGYNFGSGAKFNQRNFVAFLPGL